jgi:hypothetical protein
MHLELALLYAYAEDLVVFILHHHSIESKCTGELLKIHHQDWYSCFGLNPHDLSHQYLSWRIPELFRT